MQRNGKLTEEGAGSGGIWAVLKLKKQREYSNQKEKVKGKTHIFKN